MVWHGLAWFGMVWYGFVGIVWYRGSRLAWMIGMDDWHGWLAWMTGMDDWHSWISTTWVLTNGLTNGHWYLLSCYRD